ncbi:SH3 domain-containing protein [Leminorella grimontii]|nr:SH3 domain-containing protein [Leminorella grimontii]
MLKFKRFSTLLLISLSIASFGAAAAEVRYISDDLITYLRGGPSDNHRITGAINAGEKVQLVSVNNDTKYAQITDAKGRTAWLPLSQLEHRAQPERKGAGARAASQRSHRQACQYR